MGDLEIHAVTAAPNSGSRRAAGRLHRWTSEVTPDRQVKVKQRGWRIQMRAAIAGRPFMASIRKSADGRISACRNRPSNSGKISVVAEAVSRFLYEEVEDERDRIYYLEQRAGMATSGGRWGRRPSFTVLSAYSFTHKGDFFRAKPMAIKNEKDGHRG